MSGQSSGADERTLYFLHIPRTAGTSLRTYLEDHFNADEICPAWLVEDLLTEPPSRLRRYRLIAGHFAAYMYTMLPHEPRCVTILRDPVARSVSHFAHILDTANHWAHQRCRVLSFDEFVRDPMGELELLNMQCRFLVADDLQTHFFEHFDRTRYADPGVVEQACRRLDSLAFVGLAEAWSDSLRLLAHTFGWPPPGEFPRYNASVHRFDARALQPETLARVQELTELDRQLYEHARGLFAERVAALTPEVAEESYRRAMAGRPHMARVMLGFERAILGDGWLPREPQPDGSVCRWTGPEAQASLDLPLLATRDLEIQFRAGTYADDLLPTVRLRLNGAEVPLALRRCRIDSKSEGVFRGVLPAAILAARPEFARLTFEVERTVQPQAINRSDPDTRQLGIYFHWIDIFPRD